MKIFLTGATGVIGTRALPALVAAGHDVTAVARGDAKAELVRALGGAPVAVDLFDRDAVAHAVVGHEAVIHLATHIPPLLKAARKSAWRTNNQLRSDASCYLAEAARDTGATHYIQESIAFPYADAGDDWTDEDHRLEHDGPFAAAANAEAVAAGFAAAGGTGVALRFALFYSADSAHVRTFNALARRRINPFVGDPRSYISFIHAEDAGAAVAAALRVPSGVYNVADDEPLTRADAAQVVAEALGVKRLRSLPRAVRALSPPSAKLMMRSLRIANRRFRLASGWAPAHRSIRGSWPVTP